MNKEKKSNRYYECIKVIGEQSSYFEGITALVVDTQEVVLVSVCVVLLTITVCSSSLLLVTVVGVEVLVLFNNGQGSFTLLDPLLDPESVFFLKKKLDTLVGTG